MANTGIRQLTTNVGGVIKRIWYSINGTTATAELMSIDDAGVLSVKNIKFPATQAPSSDPNTLDDYEEGSWTPTITSLGGSLTTVTVNSARYIKIGALVTLSLDFTVVDKGTATGFLKATLPFANGSSYCALTGKERTSTGCVVGAEALPNQNYLVIVKYDGTDFIGNNYRYIITGTFCV